MKKAVSLALISLLATSIFSFALKTAHSPQPEGQFVVDEYTLALWHLNEGGGQVLHDESPHHNDGTLGLTSNAEDTDPSWVSGCTGETGDYALSFDQYFDHAYIPDNLDGSLDLQLLPQFTIEFWTYSRQISRADRGTGQHWNYFFHKAPAPTYPEEIINGYGVSQSIFPQPTPLFFASMCSGSGPTVLGSWGINVLPPLLNEWVHITIVYDGNHSRIYFNNIMQAVVDSWRIGDLNFSDNAAPFVIGDWPELDWPWADSVDGIIDEVRLSSIARDRVHNIDTGLNYATIQEAIDAAETLDGHTIQADAGTYFEHVIIHKSILLAGQDTSTTTIDGSFIGDVVNVTANNVTIVGFTIQNSWPAIGAPNIGAGICFAKLSMYNNISGNLITSNGRGIFSFYSSYNVISGNNITNNHFGVDFYYSSYNVISGNNITNNFFGIDLLQSSNATVSENHITANDNDGIGVYSSSYNVISRNNMTANIRYSILLDSSPNNTIRDCTIMSNTCGLGFFGSTSNTVSGNKVAGNKYGVELVDSSGNYIYHNNFIDNAQQVQKTAEPLLANAWDDGQLSPFFREGNYWSDYSGVDEYHGIYQNETGGDWKGDTPYIIGENNQDNYPLMDKWWRGRAVDTNHDGIVNIIDISLAAKAFGSSYPDQPRWDYKADVDLNHTINILDLAKIAYHFQQTDR